MKPLEEFLSEQSEITIQTLASYIQQYIQEQWQPVLQKGQEELLHLYDKAGEGAAYGTYAHRLFQPVQEQLKRAGFRSSPNFPGTLSTSREWGPLEERERWMWSVARRGQGAPLGTLVMGLFHDHTRFRIPHAPCVLALEQTDNDAIAGAISRAAVAAIHGRTSFRKPRRKRSASKKHKADRLRLFAACYPGSKLRSMRNSPVWQASTRVLGSGFLSPIGREPEHFGQLRRIGPADQNFRCSVPSGAIPQRIGEPKDEIFRHRHVRLQVDCFHLE